MSKLNDLANFGSRIRIFDAIESILDELGSEMVETIRTRVRLGFGLKADGEIKSKFVPLMPSTIKARQRMATVGALFPGSTARRSHLTMTGQMMDELTYEKGKSHLTILFGDEFADNKAEWAHDGSSNREKRPFMFLTDKEIKNANRLIQKGFDNYIDQLAKNL